MVKLFYAAEEDIFAMVTPDGEIFKYVGSGTLVSEALSYLFPLDKWYPSGVHPALFESFEFIGEL